MKGSLTVANECAKEGRRLAAVALDAIVKRSGEAWRIGWDDNGSGG